MFSNILNIFADASINTKIGVACAGAMLYDQYDQFSPSQLFPRETEYLIQVNATNNSAEILAIAAAINIACRYMIQNKLRINETVINVFSDSKISLVGMREWIFDWVARQSRYGILYNSSGNTVSNQNRFIDIARSIIDNKLNVRFLHQRGHVSPAKYNDPKMVNEFFEENEPFSKYTNMSFAEASARNDVVDRTTRYVVVQVSGCLESGLHIMDGINLVKRGMPSNGIYNIPILIPTVNPIIRELHRDEMEEYFHLTHDN